MFGLFFHPKRSDDGRPVAMRVLPGKQSGATTDLPAPVNIYVKSDLSTRSKRDVVKTPTP